MSDLRVFKCRILPGAAVLFLLACGSSSNGTSETTADSDGGPDVDGDQLGASDSSVVADSGNDAGAATTRPGDSAGTATGSLLVTVRIQWSNIPTPRGNAAVTVQDLTGTQLAGANVTVTPAGGGPLTGTSSNFPGVYNVPLTTWASAYDVSVTHAQGTRSGIHLTAPPVHTVTISGTPATATPLSVTWTPNADPYIQADVQVQASSPVVEFDAQSGDTSFDKSDKGTYTIPASVFTGPGSYNVSVQRYEKIAVEPAFVELIEATTVDVVSF